MYYDVRFKKERGKGRDGGIKKRDMLHKRGELRYGRPWPIK